jgi:integrase|tara:strand:+ start:887 stop:2083 length:1197 start_codon:yes stop_codon:yes gene_type:complete
MTNKLVITDSIVDKMKKPKKVPRRGKKPKIEFNRIWDTKQPGLYIQMSPEGTKTWYVFYRVLNRKTQRNYKLGKYPTMQTQLARRTAKAKLGLVAQGHDPHLEDQKIVKQGTVAEWSKYYTDKLPKSQSIRAEKMVHRVHMVPALGKLLIGDVIEDDIQNLFNSYYNQPATHNKVKAYVGKFFGWAKRNRRMTGVIFNPCVGSKQLKTESRKFHFTQIQFKKVSAYLQKMEKVEGYEQEVYYVGLLIAVGCRPSEMFSRRWGDVSFETNQLVNIPTKTGTKNIELGPVAIDLLKRLHTFTGKSKWLFPSPMDPNKHRVNFRTFWDKFKDKTGLDKGTQIRDLRTNFGTQLINSGVEIATLSALLNHSDIATTSKHYAHLLTATKQKALSKTNKLLKAI